MTVRYIAYSEPTGTSAFYCIPCRYLYLTIPTTRAVVNDRTGHSQRHERISMRTEGTDHLE